MTDQGLQLLQINVVSAQDLAPISRSMQTYAMVWVNPARKMTTRVDPKGANNPEWNDKFLFRVTPGFLHSESATVVIEIYAQAWIRDTLVGSVQVPVASIIPANPNKQARRAVALQIRRPSSRPRGILNIVVSIQDGTMKSLPLSGLDGPEEETQIRRAKSERVGSIKGSEVRPGSECNGPGSEAPPGGSMCNSDVGPSPSVVAAAVAKGLYIPPTRGGAAPRGGGVKDDGESSILQWADENSEEGLMTKIERWRTELNPQNQIKGRDQSGARHKRRHHRKKTHGARLFRCFGKGYGFEFTIVCGANHHDKGKTKVHNKKLCLPSSEVSSNSQSYIVL